MAARAYLLFPLDHGVGGVRSEHLGVGLVLPLVLPAHTALQLLHACAGRDVQTNPGMSAVNELSTAYSLSASSAFFLALASSASFWVCVSSATSTQTLCVHPPSASFRQTRRIFFCCGAPVIASVACSENLSIMHTGTFCVHQLRAIAALLDKMM